MVIHCYTTSVGLGETLPQNVIHPWNPLDDLGEPFTGSRNHKKSLAKLNRPEVQQTIDAGKKAEFAEFGNKFFRAKLFS